MRIGKLIIMSLMIITFIGCSPVDNTESKVSPKDIAGIYHYENKVSPKEDKYITIEHNADKYLGLYYGTSDEFDEAREGYYPGYFVLEMKELQIVDNSVSFYLELNKDETFSNPIDLRYKSSAEIDLSQNPLWINSHISGKRNYSGVIDDAAIILKIEDDEIVFKLID